METLIVDYRDQETGDVYTIYGDGLEDMADELPEDYDGAPIAVHRENGELVGWLLGYRDWRYS